MRYWFVDSLGGALMVTSMELPTLQFKGWERGTWTIDTGGHRRAQYAIMKFHLVANEAAGRALCGAKLR